MDMDHYAKLKPLIEFNIELTMLVKESGLSQKCSIHSMLLKKYWLHPPLEQSTSLLT